ncbi:MAG TPA: nuclear transport factor 2 family protein [Candidatus Limnocylindrales bacterium]|nr:nuclear transport factor 2 family protein [Candidatus Limnocylindrales bacterium]
MTHEDVQAWLDRYVEAWQSYDREQIAALFSEDAEYRYHPWDDPLQGREAIVNDWLSPGGDPAQRDPPGTVEASYRPFAVDGDVAVATGTSTYYADASRHEVFRRYHNAYLITFDASGKCRSFTEFFMKENAAR